MKVVRFHFLLIILITTFSQVHAQLERFRHKLSAIEISAGSGLVSLYGTNISQNNGIRRLPKLGYSARIGLLYPITSSISIDTGLLFERKGIRTDLETTYYDADKDINNCECTLSIGTIETNSNIDYLTLSGNTQFDIANTSIKIEAGPYISYLLRAQSISQHSWDNVVSYTTGNQTIKDYDMGISIGLSYQISINKKLLVLRLIDRYGLVNISNASVDKGITRTNALSFMIGFKYKLSKQ